MRLFDAGVPIRKAASDSPGITDDDVSECRPLSEVAAWLQDGLIECGVAGDSCKRFDLPLILCELRRAGVEPDLADNRVLDAYAGPDPDVPSEGGRDGR